jgi:L-lactate utilization protein LutC
MPKQFFDLRIDIAALDNDGLVNYGKEYANEQEYSIDDMGVLALYTRIADMQTNEHAVTVEEVRELVDEAIRNSEKKNISHFMDVLLAKRYDDEDMIVLREKDFLK